MPKRKSAAEDAPPAQDTEMRDHDSDSSSSDDDDNMLDVDFEWFDPQPATDFHGLKTLLRQLLDADAQQLDLSALADVILAQPLLGSTVKVDGNESDPFAFLTVLNLRQHAAVPVIRDLTAYLARKSGEAKGALAGLETLLLQQQQQQQQAQEEQKQTQKQKQQQAPTVGLILSERFINMPAEIITPCYTMLQEEIAWALEEREPYAFTHYLVLSKVYREVDSKLDAQESRPQKKGKKGGAAAASTDMTFYFHPEDEKLHDYSAAFGSFEYDLQGDEGASDSKRAFQDAGIVAGGHLVLIEAARFADAIKGVGEFLSG